MKARELQEYLRTLAGDWMDWDTTVDGFEFGDPETEIKGIAIGWLSYTDSLKKAVALGCNVFITHEPSYYYFDRTSEGEVLLKFKGVREKKEFIEKNRLVVLRCHDLWDQLPPIGVTDSWGEQLGLGKSIAGTGYFRLYKVDGKTSLEVARDIARRVKELGQEAVQFVGPGDKQVKTIVTGCGAWTPLREFIEEFNPDMVVCTDDGSRYCSDSGLATDMNIPIVVLNHATSELPGIRKMAEHLQKKFPQIPIHYIPQTCTYRLVTE
jgi:putative NIF3 family GTP cyclohydrolase 1 type 2